MSQFDSYANRREHGLGSSGTSQASNSSTSLSSAFLHLTKKQVQFFDHVIDLLPENATDFSQLKKAYNLARQDVQSILGTQVDQQTDTALWDALLRLTHIRARTWAQRWDAVRTSLGLQPLNVSEDDTSEQSSIEADDENDSTKRFFQDKQRPRSWHANRVRETPNEMGQGSSSTVMESPAASRLQRHQSDRIVNQNELEQLRARMAALTAQASTLASSLKNPSEAEVVPVNRPSILVKQMGRTPVANRDRKLRFAKSEERFDISKATTVESASDEDDKRTLKEPSKTRDVASSSTPVKRRFDEVVARSRLERDAARRAAEAQQEAENEAQLSHLYRQADAMYAMTVQNRCFSWWLTLHRKRQSRLQSAVQERNTSLQQKAFQSWKAKADNHRKKQNSAVKIDVVRCKLRAWRTWIRRLKEERKKQREEKRMELRGAFEVIRSRMEHRIVSETFAKWRISWMEVRATRFRSEHLLRGAMSLWTIQTWQTSSLREKEQQIVGKQSQTLIRLAFTRWTQAYKTHNLLEVAQSFDRQLTLRTFFERWSHAKAEQAIFHRKEALADRWRQRRIKQKVWMKWSKKTVTIMTQQEEAIQFENKLAQKRISTFFHFWLLREREQLFQRITSARILTRSITTWHDKMITMKESLREREMKVVAMQKQHLLQRTFSIWRDTTFKIVSAQELAARGDRRKLLSEALAAWKRVNEKRMVDERKAVSVNVVNTQRRFLNLWIARRREAKLERWTEEHRQTTLRETLSLWLARTKEKRRESLAVGMLRSKMEKRVRAEVLRIWTERVIERKSAYMEAAEARDGLLIQRAWSAWMQACIKHEDQLNLSNSFRDVKQEEWLRRLFNKWVNAARAERIRREKMEQFLMQRRRKILENVFEVWYDRFAESSLHEIELKALLQRQDAVKNDIFARWKAKTRSLPAIQLDHARIKSNAFYIWRDRLPLAKLQRQAVTHDRIQMEAKAFNHWRQMAKAKRAFRAAARFGGPSAVHIRAARRRSSGINGGANSGGVFGGGGGKTPKSRNRSSNAISQSPEDKSLQITRPNSVAGEMEDNRPFLPLDADVSSLRESDLVMEGNRRGGRNLGRSSPMKQPSHSLAQLAGRHLISPEKSEASNIPKQPTVSNWIRRTGQARDASSEVHSEPPQRDDIAGSSRGRLVEISSAAHDRRMSRTPSPASKTQSEATLRIKSSLRKGLPTSTSQRSGIADIFNARRRKQMQL
ncbi:uncharacterized protein FA14DRAFT_159575 [Meira miltonrushii]|uniref:Sfi1 spindle body domain-containing protein n=1 Tax=Meira miltonrushii TaxID=1280837 RepID=A0A316VJC2_9BASI|nr:uncharacterized protein FA14DRAFT_159575 [Meira miltonrushii]PWN37600.1 hypothetical protein FA14DRAFT_159575 [Meira miltonrushii]